MPIYEYECTQCQKIEEVIQKFSDEQLTTCPSCSGNLRKLISHNSFHLKGSGWYVTDYANAKKKDSSGDKGETASTADKTENKTEKKTEKKTSD